MLAYVTPTLHQLSHNLPASIASELTLPGMNLLSPAAQRLTQQG